MPKVDLKLYSTDATDGKKITTSVTYVNPEVSNTVLKSFAQQLNAITKNNYVETDRVETVNVDTHTSRKMFRNITITGATQGATATITVTIDENETVQPAVFFYNNGSSQVLPTTPQTSIDPLIAKFAIVVPANSGTIFAGLTAKPNFYSEFVYVDVN